MKRKIFGDFMILIAKETQRGIVYPKNVLVESIKKLDSTKGIDGYYVAASKTVPTFRFYNLRFQNHDQLMGDLEILDTPEGAKFKELINKVDFLDSYDWEIFSIRGHVKTDANVLTELDITHIIA